MEQTTPVALLEQLSIKVEAEKAEVRRAEALLVAATEEIDAFRRRPDPSDLLGGPDGRVLMAQLATGEGTAEPRRRMNARAFSAVRSPGQGPKVRRVFEELLTVLDRTRPDGVI